MITGQKHFVWCALLIVAAASTVCTADNQSAGEKERELIAVLKSDAPKADKAITCKRLAIYGSEKCVPAVAPLLTDWELQSWARITLEAIPGPAADGALRDALDKVDGRLLVGVINSIAVRRDAKATDALIKKLDADNAAVASAAAVALGHLGGQKAASALTAALGDAPDDVRSAVAQGCILAAEGYLEAGDKDAAIKLYDTVRRADVADQRHLEAIRGAILARGFEGLPLLIEQLESDDKGRLGIGLRTARELPGTDVTERLAAELAKLTPARRPLLLLAISDRDDLHVLPTVRKAAASDQKDLRITAINVLIRLGDVSCTPVLLDAASSDDTQISDAATETLIRIPGRKMDAELLARLQKAQGDLRRILIEIAGQRQIADALPHVVASLESDDIETRAEAIKTIAIIGTSRQTADLVDLIVNTDNSTERATAAKALMTICGEHGRECIPYLQPLNRSSDPELRIMGLRASAIIGGPKALATVKSAAESDNAKIQDEAVRTLSTWPNNWPDDAEAAAILLELASSAEKLQHKVLGLRGYLQYIRTTKNLTPEKKVAEIEDLLAHIQRAQEKRQAIATLGDIPSKSSLELLTSFAEDNTLVEEACSAIVQVAGGNINGVSKDKRREVLKMVVEKSENNGTKNRAKKALSSIR